MDLDFEQAAGISITYFTSYHALVQRAAIQPGETLLVLGAAGGVGSVATATLSKLGYEVAAVTGRPEAADYLKSLGATTIVPREEINETVKRPLESENWAGCIDAVGGAMLAHKASREGKVAAEAIHGGEVAFDNRAIPAGVFTDPEIAWTGLTEREAEEQEPASG